MNLLKWKNDVVQLAESHERLITCCLFIVAAILILVAIYGRAHHKALAMIYIVL